MTLHKIAYVHGTRAALHKLGMDMQGDGQDVAAPEQENEAPAPTEEEELLAAMTAEELPPEEELPPMPPEEEGVETADDLVALLQNDDTGDLTNAPPEDPATAGDQPPRWGESTSLEGGDAGTRNYEMGLPSTGAA